MASITPGPWAMFWDDIPHSDMGEGWTINSPECSIAICDGPASFNEANARAISAVPELIAANQNWEIKGPDADNLVWLVLHGKGTSGKALVNLGAADRITGQVALLLENDRRAALAKALGTQSKGDL